MNTASEFSDPLVSDTPLPFDQLCTRIDDRISAFLDAQNVSDRVKNVQQQTRTSLQVIADALERYRCVVPVWGTCARRPTDRHPVSPSSRYPTTAARTVLSCSYSTCVLCTAAAWPKPRTPRRAPRPPSSASTFKTHIPFPRWRSLSFTVARYTRSLCSSMQSL